MYTLNDHPDIIWAERTGYPRDNQPVYYECEDCHDELTSDEVYTDEEHECICESCLLSKHRKVW